METGFQVLLHYVYGVAVTMYYRLCSKFIEIYEKFMMAAGSFNTAAGFMTVTSENMLVALETTFLPVLGQYYNYLRFGGRVLYFT
jgi:hypothetical protein